MPGNWPIYEELPPSFYERMEGLGWESDYVNACRILIGENECGATVEVWPIKGEDHALEVELQMTDPFSVALLRVEHRQQDDFVLDCLVRFHHQESYTSLIRALLEHPQVAVYSLKYYQKDRGEKPQECRKRLTPENLSCLSHPDFEPIAWINFYLAGKVTSTLTIPHENLERAYARIVGSERYNEGDALEAGNLQAALEELFYEPAPLDPHGNVVDVPFNGDIWDFDFLELLKDLFVPGSTLVLQDDGYVFWKVVVNPEGVAYFREKLCAQGEE